MIVDHRNKSVPCCYLRGLKFQSVIGGAPCIRLIITDYLKMDEFLLQQNRRLDDEITSIRSLVSEIASMAETTYDLHMSIAVSLSPTIKDGVRKAEAFMKEAEAQLSSLSNSSSEAVVETEVKLEYTEEGDCDGRSDDVLISPECTIDANN